MPEEQVSYYTTVDENFEKAYKLLLIKHSQQELIEMLKNGNIPQRQLAALELQSLNSKEETLILLSNLVGQDGKIREAVSLKINEFTSDTKLKMFFNPLENHKIFLDAIIDINGNVCRNIISAICNFKDDECFCRTFSAELGKRTLQMIDKVKDFDFQEGKYKVNKEVFKLYWYLETIYEFYSFVDFEVLKKIITQAKSVDEYTIREKIAKILTKDFNDEDLEKIKKELKSDKNYFVRRY